MFLFLQVAQSPQRAAGAPMGVRPSPQDQVCLAVRDLHLCPQFTLRETATEELHWLTVCGRIGLCLQVCMRRMWTSTLEEVQTLSLFQQSSLYCLQVQRQPPFHVTYWWYVSQVGRFQLIPPPLVTRGSKAQAQGLDRVAPGTRSLNLCSCLSTRPCLTASDPEMPLHNQDLLTSQLQLHTHTHSAAETSADPPTMFPTCASFTRS